MNGPFWRRVSRIDSIENHCFLPHFLTADSVVVDLGVNTGDLSRIITQRFGTRTFGVEANPQLYEKLQGTDRLKFFNLAIAAEDKPIQFNISHDILSSSAIRQVHSPDQEVTVPGKTLATFFRERGIGHVDLLKVDIEGSEIGMFASTSDEILRGISQLSVEFHDDFGWTPPQDVIDVRRRLADLNFIGIKFSPNNINWLFFQRELAGPIERAYLRYFIRNTRGALRRMGFRYD